MKISVFAVLAAASAQPVLACDLCSVYAAAAAQGNVGKGWFGGMAEQYTRFGTLQDNGHEIAGEGQYIDSSVSQVFAGYNFNSRLSTQVTLPVIYRSYGSDTTHGKVSGIGDLSVIGNFVAWEMLQEDVSGYWSLLGGIKFPTGDDSELETPDSALPEGIGGHDLALGSGSYDGLVGTSVFGRWRRVFFGAAMQYAIRSENDSGHRYANDITWSGGPGAYLFLEDKFSLSLQLNVSGEAKGKDEDDGAEDEDSAITLVALGPQLNLTRGDRLAAQLGVDVPVNIYNSGTQVVPNYRIRAAVSVRF